MTACPTDRPARTVPALSTRVLRHVMLPLALTWLAGTLITFGAASFFTRQAFDRALLDDAYAIASNVRAGPDGRVALQLTPRELTAALFDRAETVYYAVLRPDGGLLAGEAIGAAAPAEGESYRFSQVRYQGRPVRAVMLRHQVDGADGAASGDYRVMVAHTTLTRAALAERVLLCATLPQLVLLVLLALWLWRGIARDLRPLALLHDTLDKRDASDLSPVAVPPTAREIERLGQAVNALFERLGGSVRAQREFAGNVAHELRTPLAGIRALVEYGLSHASPEVWREQLQRIGASEARASHRIDQLLALALADESDAVLQREPVRLDALVQEAVLRHLAKADARGADLGARGLDEGEPRDFTVLADAALVEGILDNLIDNALRYGGRTITVELVADPQRGTCALAVVDDGPGVPEAARRDLMQRWAQGPDGHRLRQGAGLGLAIVARYAQLLDARLLLDSAGPQGGLRAEVVLHRVVGAPAPASGKG
ncbi:MAG: sensor histidine kinase N-terminal domain-containing protein [Xenophilus sp.]